MTNIPSIHPHSTAGWWRFPDVLHCHDGKADCSDVLYIFSVSMSVYHGQVYDKTQNMQKHRWFRIELYVGSLSQVYYGINTDL